jgi:hypothetical protein
MRPARILHFLVFASLLASSLATAAPGNDAIDDPKLARRLKSRTTVPAPSSSSPSPSPSPSPVGDPSRLLPPPLTAAPPLAGAAPTAPMAGEVALAAAPAGPSPSEAHAPLTLKTPTIGIGYRRFSFVQVGATTAGSPDGAAAAEPFNSLSLDFYPISRLVRFGLSTQYGWQDGQFSGGDYFIAQSTSLGIQHAGSVVTPFAEAFAGGGYMRRFQFDRTIPTAYWQFGVDAGANFFLGEHGFVSVALGYLRPVNGFAKETSFASVYVDTWSLKIGVGL